MDFSSILSESVADLESQRKLLLAEGGRIFHDNGLNELFKFITSTAVVGAPSGTDARKIADVMTKVAITAFYKKTGGNLGVCTGFFINEGVKNDYYYLVITASCGYTTIRDRCSEYESQNVIVACLDPNGEIFIYRTDNPIRRFCLTRDTLTKEVLGKIIMFILTGKI